MLKGLTMKKIPDLTTQKKQLRKILKEQRNSLDRESCASSDNAIFTNIRTWDIYQKAYTVFCFVGTEDEIHSMDDLAPGKYGILEPVDTCEKISPKEIDLALIPCLSCGRDGHRLGYGGGYYDRYLNQVKGTLAVLCRRALMCDEIPTEDHDKNMDFVICEEGILNIHCKN